MKKLRKLISILLAVTSCFSLAVSVSADGGDTLGDIDDDGSVTIFDGTRLQMHIAELKALSASALRKADTDLDGDANVLDVTHLQRYIAKESGVYYLGYDIDTAVAMKAKDDETARAEADEQNRLVQEASAAEKAKEEEKAARAERTSQAQEDYQTRYKELSGDTEQKANIEASIKNYKRQKGVDISVYNGDVDFNKLKKAGYTFVIIRMGFGGNLTSQDDTLFEQNVKKAEAAGMPWGAYLYSYALNTTSVESEVKHTLRLLTGKKPTMPIAFDIENDTYKAKNGMPSDKMLHDICVTYLKGIEKAGYYPILYTGYHWLTGALNAKDLTGTYDIWYAQWSTKMDYQNTRIGMWQYGGEVNYIESPYISGLNGMFDKDYCYKNYPVIIPAYGYNNHTAILSGKYAATSSLPDDGYTDEELNTEDGIEIPKEYKGVMGNSFK